ncbi:hypothetical protein [Vibrio sp. SCSIO 43137]|uniref:hypothetical protein n=1 Tax=Vibrio sp. SCSIO 43137 TaxID=3021011 RepID=UPI002307C494|nr:hypothetical protein [Vibrio sp. SCSIO 43137]WCE29978.1 hypothetical protein PK654_01305 [Vibrio sp. SCSIO 43137]
MMGVLGDQPVRTQYRVREDDLEMFLSRAQELADTYSTSIEAVIEAKKALELERKNNIQVESGDYSDEHMGGLGEILSRIANALEDRK